MEKLIGEEELAEDNVIEAIELYRCRSLGREGQSYCYHSRKQDVTYRHLLKEVLLRKYKLTPPQANFQNITVKAPLLPSRPKNKRIHKQQPRTMHAFNHD